MKKVEEAAVRVAALAAVDRPLNAYHKRANRRIGEVAQELYERLAGGEEPSGRCPVNAQQDWENGASARGYKEGVEEFSRIHPDMAEELRGIIAHQRDCRRTYVTWELRRDLPKKYVMKVLGDLGLEGEAADRTYEALQDMALGVKETNGSNRILVKV